MAPTPVPARFDHFPRIALCFYPYSFHSTPLFPCELVMCLLPLLSPPHHPVMSTYPAMSSWKTPRTWVSLNYGGKETMWLMNLWSLIPGTWNLFKTVLFALSNYSEMINYHWLMRLWVILFSLHLTVTYFYNYKYYTTLKCFSIT